MANSGAYAEESPLTPLQVCRALTDFEGQQEGDLSFQQGEKIIIIEPSEALFWYKAKNIHGQEGLVPRTFLEAISDRGKTQIMDEKEGSEVQYLPMNRVADEKMRQDSQQDRFQHGDPVIKEMFHIHDKELKRRLPPGTLVIGTCQFLGENIGDLPFNVYEEMSILHPLQDLCWYYAQKTETPQRKGAIPITHVRLVYMSDDDDDDMTYSVPTNPAHDRLYDDINDFVSQSGWFSHPGLTHGKAALEHVVAKKAGLSYETFAAMQSAVYLLNYRQGEKMYVGHARILKDDICKHFENFGKKRDVISNVDDEICHHTECAEWDISVWPFHTTDLEYECAKKVIELNTLVSKDSQKGLTEKLCFTTMQSFYKLWEWFSPK